MESKPVSLAWFRLDLRLDDNPAFLAAAEAGSAVIPVFIWAPEEEEPWPTGAASRWWLHQSLSQLQASLAALGSRLILRRGPTLQALDRLIFETGATAVFWNRRYEPATVIRDAAIEHSLRDRGIRVATFASGTLFDPALLRSKNTQRPFQVFTPFWKTCLSQPEPPVPQEAPPTVPQPSAWPESLTLSDLKLEPKLDWTAGMAEVWTPGEAGANAQLAHFVSKVLKDYPQERNLPGHSGTSRLSSHLHFGEISPRRVWHTVQKVRQAENSAAADCYLKEIGWSEFAHHILFHFPHTPNGPLQARFAAFPWRNDSTALKKWQRGQTGYPIVDAGLRELWTTGWMHNRVRMIAASFLTKHLRIDWQEGAYWFWETLVDADLANNTLGWQWTAGCGADAAPYFRIFNPVRQSSQFDPPGEYIKRWVPELAHLAPPYIHAPWTAPPLVLEEAGVRLGNTYPLPIVDHASARRQALDAFERIRRP